MHYPIGRVFDEAAILVERRNGELISVAVIIQAATATTGMAAGKEAAAHFKQIVDTLQGD